MEESKRPQDKWNEKNGYISKSFRMYRSLADEFKQVCESQGESQAKVITTLMKDYIKEHQKDRSKSE